MIRILESRQMGRLLARRTARLSEAEAVVRPILEAVRKRGDKALLAYARKFDGLERKSVRVPERDLAAACGKLSPQFRAAVETASANIRAFAEMQMPMAWSSEVAPGLRLGQILRPLDTVAAYIPAGRYPLPSTLMMTAIPARVAGVRNICVASPRPVAETYGTAAKKLLAGEVGIDFVAGPTEIVIVAAEGEPRFLAADLLAQAEHDVDACAVLLTPSRRLANAVAAQVRTQLATLP